MQNFVLPTMPFRRDIPAGFPVGTTFKLTGKPYEDIQKSIFVIFNTNNGDQALRVELVLVQPSKLKIDCTVSQKKSTAVETLVVCPLNQRAVLKIITSQHSFQILFNESKVADFVHRVDPTLVKSVLVSGPMITEDVTITPGTSQPLPSYEQATSPPVEMMANMNLGTPQKVPLPDNEPFPPAPMPQPAAPPTQITMTTAPGSTGTTSSSFYFTGGSQGFSNHPYPLPGLIDNSTHASQQNPVGTLPPQTSMPSAPPITQAPPTPAGAAYTSPYTSVPMPQPPSSVPLSYTPAPTPSVPYTVTYPQSANSTPGIPQPLPQQMSRQQAPIYQNQQQMPPGYNPYLQQQQQQMAATVPMPYPSGAAAVPVSAMAPQVVQYPTTVVPYSYPAVQPYPMYQQYPMGYGYQPEVYYYDGGHHHHRHHHHHCD
ncbi:Galectin [Caenorhabditis elegans]|uniref:Galectin n=1 Tax=Caenorhabditis elegans TaxID=6239 RepID=Q9UA61_CAEEL|nr:Galectin domain-containing protein [Caenorhabditis elegans]CCD68649.1 Galectin domain-containing protein [Caenorhabditis elegans]|eukprot:NP_741097.1 Galectin [Caenorhabditis elegans]